MSDRTFKTIFLIVQLAAVGVFLGRAWQHLFWDAPFRTLFWEEQWIRPLVEGLFNTSWDNYTTNPNIDHWIDNISKGFGLFYLLCALVALFAKQLPRYFWKLLLIGSAALILLALLYCKERFFSVGQFFEYSLQFLTPYFLYRLLKDGRIDIPLLWTMRIAIALTFTCHGLYAINYYPRPGLFVEMTMNILGVEEAGAHLFLWWAGVLDFVVSAMILLLPGRWLKLALGYAIIWGMATSIARIWANLYSDMLLESLSQWTFEVLYRVPHFLIPLAVFYYFSVRRKMSDSSPSVAPAKLEQAG